MAEEWRPIPSLPGYFASSLGRIRCNNEKSNGNRLIRGGWCRDRHRVTIARRSYAVPRLVLEAFVGPMPQEGMHAAHLNGNSRDNRPANLVWATREENESHKALHGTKVCGDRSNLAALTEREVRAIRHLFECGVGRADMARAFGVTRHAIHKIESGENWSHLDEAANATAPAGDGWIACSERMPDEGLWGAHVLVYAPRQEAFGCTYGPIIDTAGWDSVDAEWSTDWEQTLTITHWRPLHAPPAAGSEGE